MEEIYDSLEPGIRKLESRSSNALELFFPKEGRAVEGFIQLIEDYQEADIEYHTFVENYEELIENLSEDY